MDRVVDVQQTLGRRVCGMGVGVTTLRAWRRTAAEDDVAVPSSQQGRVQSLFSFLSSSYVCSYHLYFDGITQPRHWQH